MFDVCLKNCEGELYWRYVSSKHIAGTVELEDLKPGETDFIKFWGLAQKLWMDMHGTFYCKAIFTIPFASYPSNQNVALGCIGQFRANTVNQRLYG